MQMHIYRDTGIIEKKSVQSKLVLIQLCFRNKPLLQKLLS